MPPSAQPPPFGHEARVEKFITDNPVEENAADRFRQLPWEYQTQVIQLGGLNGARIPSAVLLGRIKTVIEGQQEALSAAAAEAPAWTTEEMQYSLAVQLQLQAQQAHQPQWYQEQSTAQLEAAQPTRSYKSLMALSKLM